jgi:DNA-binding transcriptional MocR family regulator
MSSQMPASQLLYEQVAARFVTLIESGTLQTGERLPSVRKLAAQQGVSVATVVGAYRKLEFEGWLEARPQSGYYVRRRTAPRTDAVLPPEPEVSQPRGVATPVEMADLTLRFTHAMNQPDLIHLGLAVCAPAIHPTRQLHRALIAAARNGDESNCYDFSPGSSILRSAIAGRSLEAGCTLSPDDLVLTLGALEALNLCLRAVCEPGDTVVLESPTYYCALQAIEVLGLRALEVPTHPRDGIVLEALEEVLERESVKACLLMPCFSNPLGSRMPDSNKRRLVQMLREREIPLIEDDVWADTSFEAPRPLAAKSFDQDGWVMLCSSYSKTLGPGLRVGWVAPGRWKKRVEYLKLVSNVANPTLPSLAIAEFLRQGGYDYHLRRMRRLCAEGVECALQAVGRYFPEGTCVTRPRGGHMLWVELPARVNALELFEAALREGISIAPGPLFSARRKFDNCVRLNCAFHPPEIVESALQTLGNLVAARI